MSDTKNDKIAELKEQIKAASKGMTERQKMFVDFLMTSQNMTKKDAYKKAYPNTKDKGCESSSARVSKLPRVEKYLALRMELRAIEHGIDADWVLKQAVKVHERCMQAVPVLDREGNHVYVETADGDILPSYTFEHVGANKSLEIIGKHVSVQAFNEKTSTTHKIITDDGSDAW